MLLLAIPAWQFQASQLPLKGNLFGGGRSQLFLEFLLLGFRSIFDRLLGHHLFDLGLQLLLLLRQFRDSFLSIFRQNAARQLLGQLVRQIGCVLQLVSCFLQVPLLERFNRLLDKFGVNRLDGILCERRILRQVFCFLHQAVLLLGQGLRFIRSQRRFVLGGFAQQVLQLSKSAGIFREFGKCLKLIRPRGFENLRLAFEQIVQFSEQVFLLDFQLRGKSIQPCLHVLLSRWVVHLGGDFITQLLQLLHDVHHAFGVACQPLQLE